MYSSKVSQEVPSATTSTEPVPAARRITRSRTQSSNKGFSVNNKGIYIIFHTPTLTNTTSAEKQATSSREAGGSRQGRLTVASHSLNQPEFLQIEVNCFKRFIDHTGPANRSDPIENLVAGLQVEPKATKATGRKASVQAKKALSTRVTPYTRVPWNAEEVNELRRLMSLVVGYPSVRDRKNWAEMLNK